MTSTAGGQQDDVPGFGGLGREEWIEQAHFFGTLVERLGKNTAAQDILQSVREEVLATTKLPLAIDFLLAELKHLGVLAPAMRKLKHYFTPFQCFIMKEAEDERRRFDLRVALDVLRREVEYRAAKPTQQGLFLYQLEALCRNRLHYDEGLAAVAEDPGLDDRWRDWIQTLRRQIGMVDLADLIYVQSAYYHQRHDRAVSGKLPAGDGQTPSAGRRQVALFGEREGRIALANRLRDPLVLFASLHRQLGYPEVPFQKPANPNDGLLPSLARRVEQLETRLKLVEEEQRGGIDLSRFYGPPKE